MTYDDIMRSLDRAEAQLKAAEQIARAFLPEEPANPPMTDAELEDWHREYIRAQKVKEAI